MMVSGSSTNLFQKLAQLNQQAGWTHRHQIYTIMIWSFVALLKPFDHPSFDMLPFLNAPLEWVANFIGTGPDELKLIFSMLLSYPLAGVVKQFPDAKPAYKNLFVIATGAFYLVGLFNLWGGLRTILIAAGGAYAIAYFGRGSPYMPWLGFVFLMVHLSINQLERQFANNPAVLDITGAQMVLVMKLSAFCWNVADGTLPKDQLSEFQRHRALTELPGLLDFAGWVFFFPSLLCGPTFDLAEYSCWLDTSMFDVPSTIDPAKKPSTRKKRRIPQSSTPAMLKMATGLVWLLLFMTLSGWYSPEGLYDDSIFQLGWFKRVWIMYITNFTARMKYYGAWSLTEGACIMSGLGFNGVDPVTGRISWDRVENICPWGVETAQNTRAYLGNWNKKTNDWLRNCIYLRITPMGMKPGFRASMATFLTSAVWHGFYPGYYLSFILASSIQAVAKNCRRYFRPFFLDPVTQKPTEYKIYYDVLSLVATQVAFTFATTPFIVLGLTESIKAWSAVYWYCPIGVAAAYAFFASPARQILKKQIEARSSAAGVPLIPSESIESLATGGCRDRNPLVGGPSLTSDVDREAGEAAMDVVNVEENQQRLETGKKEKTICGKG